MNPRNDGLGLSLLIYLTAMLCGLSVVALPLYFAMRPTVIENANAHMLKERDTLIVGASQKPFPLLRLKQPPVVDPATVAKMNAKATKKVEHAKVRPRHATPVHVASDSFRQRPRPAPADAYAEARTPHRRMFVNNPAMF